MVDMGFFHGMIMYLNCVFEVFLFYHYLNTWFPFYEEDKKIRILESGIFAKRSRCFYFMCFFSMRCCVLWNLYASIYIGRWEFRLP